VVKLDYVKLTLVEKPRKLTPVEHQQDDRDCEPRRRANPQEDLEAKRLAGDSPGESGIHHKSVAVCPRRRTCAPADGICCGQPASLQREKRLGVVG
jgi:hypothetical protein